MKYLKSVAAVALCAMAITSQASAYTVNDSQVVQGEGELTSMNGLGFDWDSTPFAAYFEFTVDSRFDFQFTNYGENNVFATTERSAFTLDVLDNGTETRLTNESSTACSSADSPVGGDCTFVDGSNVGETFFKGLSSGTYRLGFYDSARPEAGYAEFNVAEVPLPAGAVLLVSALGGLGVARRRRKAATA